MNDVFTSVKTNALIQTRTVKCHGSVCVSCGKADYTWPKTHRKLCSKCLHGFKWVKIYFQAVALNCSDSYSHKTQMQHESTKSGSSWFSMKQLQKVSWWLTQTGAFLPTDDRTQKLQHVQLNPLTGFNIWLLGSSFGFFTGIKCKGSTLCNMSKYNK